MKKLLLCGLFMTALCMGTQAQWIRVWKAGESIRYAVSDAATIPYATAGATLTIGGDAYSTAEIDSITIVNPITIAWTENGATVDIPESVEGVTATINGGNVTIDNINTWSEQEIILSGTSSAGSLTYNGDYKAKFHLNGVNLTSSSGAAIDIQCGKRIDLIVEEGTINTIIDAAGGEQKAAFYCRGHIEASGGGALTVQGNTHHAFASKEYLFLKKSFGTLNIAGAAADGIHCGEYFLMNGGTIAVNNISGDGLQVETDDESDELENGTFVMNGGYINITMATADTKGIRLDANDLVPSLVPQMYLYGGTITVTMATTATDSKAIASDGDMTIGDGQNGPDITINMNAVGYKDGTTAEKIRSTGLKVGKSDENNNYGYSGDFLLQGGNVTINATGAYSRGMNTNNFTATGGLLSVIAPRTGSNIQGIKYAGTRTGDTYVKFQYCGWKTSE